MLSPSDFTAFLECAHKLSIHLRQCLDGATIDETESPETDILKRHGLAYEASWLDHFRSKNRVVALIPTTGDWQTRAQSTLDAMRAGADVVYQAVFVDGDWRGIADFLVRVPKPSNLGDWSYEAWDTKLARKAKPAYVFQLAFYSAQIARVSGQYPDAMHVILGTTTESLSTRYFMLYDRSVRSRFTQFVADRPLTYPMPVAHCGRCEFAAACETEWRRDDRTLSLVAGIREDQGRASRIGRHHDACGSRRSRPAAGRRYRTADADDVAATGAPAAVVPIDRSARP